jgi:two-component system KDP operon response regulator KdpE
MSTVLIIDDDPQTLSVLRIAFTTRGYHVVTEAAGRAALRTTSQATPQAILLSIELSDMDGWEALVALRDLTNTPIIVLSTRHDPEEAVRALDTGADDYVAKPFGIKELLARTRAAVRRAAANPGQRGGIVDTGSFTVDLDARKVWREGAEVRLTPTEWSLLEILIRHEGHLVSQRDRLRTVWGPEHYTDTHYLRVYIGQLRRKLEPEPANPRHLITEPNQGYRFHTHRTDR